ncbi:dienelactone hydrolase family protein [Fundidesulfovibrio terrae]|uniref:dienelactone hydrolase family protein n=1 Tax=Fundidesulfovibrio terrae TaxID=2922866 RepID=UPI001FB037F0|nr:dienelactone hydrolase family protein [Fundidesulfovibrio terrae]
MLAGLCPGGVSRALAALVMEETALPARFGPGQEPTPLEAVIVRPGEPGRHPLVVISHGSPRDKKDMPGMNAVSRLREAEEFARRGFVVLVFMRRGFGASAGGFAETVGTGDNPDYAASGRTAAEDIREAIRIMKAMPYVDPARIVCVGQSAGGLATLALAADPPQGVVAAVNFAGGKGSTAPDVVKKESNLVGAFAQYGRTARIPVLFVYSENDHFFGPRLARELHAAFNSAGGRAEFVMAPAFGEDGHHLFSRKGIPQWTPIVDAFLAAHGLKLREKPLPAERTRVSPPGKLAESGRQAFENYLDAPPHKAFVMGSRGGYGWSTGKRTAQEALEKATENCRSNGNDGCTPVMLDDKPR